MKYDLEERTSRYGEAIIEFAKKIPKNSVNIPLIDQIVRSGTSIGANYCEANQASSKRDFINNIYTCKKEASETKYWLRLIISANPEFREEGQVLSQEGHELNLIFSKIISTSKSLRNRN